MANFLLHRTVGHGGPTAAVRVIEVQEQPTGASKSLQHDQGRSDLRLTAGARQAGHLNAEGRPPSSSPVERLV